MKESIQTLLSSHNKHAWQPFTPMKLVDRPPIIEKASQEFLYTTDGKEIIDAIGSWWVNIHGHNHPFINEKVIKQLQKMEHVMYGGLTHPLAIELSEALSATTDHRLPRVFFSDNGSTSVEIALKMAFQFHTNQGEKGKTKILTFKRGYHGDTIGTMSVGARSVFHEMYSPLLFGVDHAPAPDSTAESLEFVEHFLQENQSEMCAVIIEPRVQGAGGMNIYTADFLKQLRQLCSKYRVFLIFDEVFTGCGRIGNFYACESADVWPDILCLSKGLSAGYFPFAATLATEEIFNGFYSDDRTKTLFHGHSMTGLTTGCAASLASLELFQAERTLEKVHSLERLHVKYLQQLKTSIGPDKVETRFLGSIAAIEFKNADSYTGEFSPMFVREALQRGVLLRPLGPVVYLTPPYTISEKSVERVYSVILDVARNMAD